MVQGDPTAPNGYCTLTCGRCVEPPAGASALPPAAEKSTPEAAATNPEAADAAGTQLAMGELAALTPADGTACTDVPPPGGFTCAQQKASTMA